MGKIYIDNSTFMEYIDELATQITEREFKENTYIELKSDLDNDIRMIFTDEAQDFYNEMYDEYETLTNNLLGVYSNTELDNLEDIAKSYRELKLNCLTDVYKEIRPCIKKFDNRSRFMILPSLEDTREHWNDIQDYKYDWGDDKDDYVYTDCLLSDDD